MLEITLTADTEEDTQEVIRAVTILKILKEECPRLIKELHMDNVGKSGKVVLFKNGQPKHTNIKIKFGRLSEREIIK